MFSRSADRSISSRWSAVWLAVVGWLGVSPAIAPAAEDLSLSPTITLDPDASPFFTAIGSATSQGVSVLRADQARSIFGVTGAGVKLGVISDSFNGSGSTPTLATQIAAGNLPGAGNPNGYTTGVTVVKDDSGTDEGRAMLEIVHDVAPGAQLYFHSAFNNTNPVTSYTGAGTPAPDRSIADAISGLSAVAGMRVIVDDVGYLTAPRFQDGPAAQAANAAFANGIAYFSAAGNSATDATRVTTSVGVSGTVNWGTDGLLLMRVGANSSGRAVLQWGEPYTSVSGSANTSNFSVAVTTTNGAATYFTIDNQSAGQDPYEFISLSNSGTSAVDVALRVTRSSGTSPVLMQLSTFGSGFTIIDADKTNAPTIYGQAAATGAVAVAASYWGTPTTVESFSSRGPTQILFDANGNPVNELRSTPLLTAPDGGTTTTSGFNSFYGTSAAAPHAAAVAALVMERFDQKGLSYSTRDVYQVLYDSAVDIGTAGFDSASGYGRIDALAAVGAGRIWDGNGATAGVSGTGSWSQAKWTLESTGDKPTGKFIRGQQAIFGSGTAAQASYAVSVDGSYDVAGLQFARDTVTLASGSGALRLTAPTVEVASGLTASIAASLTGTGGLEKTGAGTLRLTGTTGYTGGTTVSAGTLVANGNLVASGPMVVGSGATLAGSGAVGSVTLTANSTIAPGNSPGTLTTGDVIFGAGGNYNWQMTSASGSAGLQWDFIASSGSLTVNATVGNPFAINLWTLSGTGPDVSGPAANFNQLSSSTWKIGSFAGGITGFASNLFSIVTGSANGTAGFANAFLGTFSLATLGNDLNLVYSAPAVQNYDYVGGTGNFTTGTNWAGDSAPTGYGTINFVGPGGTATNDLVTLVNGLAFSGSAGGGYVVAGNAMSVGAGGVVNDSPVQQTVEAGLTLTAAATVAANAGNLALAGGLDTGGFGVTVAGAADTTIASLSGAGGLVKTGNGTLTLSASNSYTGGTTLNAGRIVAGSPSALGSSTNALVVNGGTLDTGEVDLALGALSGSGGALLTTGSGEGTRTLRTTVASGTSTFAGTLTDNGSGRLALSKRGGGTLVLSGSSSATGGIALDSGTLQVGSVMALGGTATPLAVNGGTLNTGTFSLSVGSLSGSSGAVIITATSAGMRTLATTIAAGTSIFAGTIVNSGSGVMALTKLGGGTLVIAGSNANTGTTTIASGSLVIGTGGTSGRLGTGPITNNAALAFNRTDAYGGAVTNLISGSGSVTLTGGTLTLTAANGYTGGTTIQAGTLLLGNALAIGGTATALAVNGGTLNVQTFSPSIGALSGSGGTITTVNTAGTRTLTTTVPAGATSVFAGSIQNSGSGIMAVTKAGAGTLVLAAANTYSGTTTTSAGTLVAGDAAALGVGAVNVLSGTLSTGTFDLSIGALTGGSSGVITTAADAGTRTLMTTVAGTTAYAGALRDNGVGKLAIVKDGTGTLTLSGSSSLTGGVTLTAGNIQIGSAFGLGGTSNPVAVNGGTLNTGTFSLAIGALSGSAGGVITTSTAAGTRTLATTVASGTSLFAGSIQNSGSGIMALTKAGAGTLVIAGSNSYTGATTVSGGTLQVGEGGTSGALGSGAVTNNGTLVFSRSDDYGGGFGGAISGSGSVRVQGGAVTLTGSNGYTGATTIVGAMLQVGNGGTAGRIVSGTIVNDGALVFNRSDAYGGAVASVITGTGGLTLSGGTLTLTAVSPFSGPTVINAGTLRVNGSLASSEVAVNAGGQLSGSGAVGGLVVNTGGTLMPGTNAGSLTAGDVIFGAGGAYNWQLTSATGTAGMQWDFLNSSGSLTVAATTASPFAVNLWTLSGTGADVSGSAANFNQYANQNWKIGTFAGGISGFDSTLFSIVTEPANGTGGFANAFTGTFSIAAVGNDLRIVYSAPIQSSYDYTGGTGSFSDPANWSLDTIPAGTPTITFSGAGGTATNDLLTAVTGLTFTGSATGGYVLTGSGLAVGFGGVTNDSAFAQTVQSPLVLTATGTVAANAAGLLLSGGVDTAGFGLAVAGAADTSIASVNGAGGLLKDGAGKLTLSGSNAFTGGVTLAGGRLVTGDPLALGGTANTVAVNGGTLDIGTANLAVGALSGPAGGVITTGSNAGTRTLTTLVSAGTATYAGALRDNNAGLLGLAKSGSGTLVLSGSNAYTGGTVIAGGTLQAAHSAALGGSANAIAVNAGTLDVGMSSVTVGALSGSAGGVVTTAATAGTRTLTTTVAAGTSTYAGSLRDNGIGKLALVKSGSGTLTLSGSNAATGGLTIAAGTLQAGHAFALGGTSNPLAVNGGTLNTGTFSLAVGSLSGSAGGVITTATTAGTRTLTTNVASGTSVFAGTLQNSGSGVLALTKTGAGALVLTGSNGASGATTLSAGTLQIGAGGTSGRLGAGTIANNGALVFNRTDDYGGALGNVISGTGSLTLVRGSLTLSGSTSFTGETRANSGTLTLAHSRALAGSTLDLNAADTGSVVLSGTGVQTYSLGGLEGTRNLDMGANSLSVGGNNQTTTYSGVITGSGALVKTGIGGLTLSGSNSYAGGTTISGGTLQVGAGGSTGSLGGGAIVNNATLAFNRSDNYGGPFASSISGSGSLRLMSGSLTLTGSNGSTGSTTLTGGTLQIGTGGTAGSLGTGPITNNATLIFNRSDDYGGPVANAISGTGSLTLLRGSLTVTGSSSSTGPTTISGGVLQVGNGGTIGRLGGGAITNNGALVFSRTDGYGGTVANSISGTGSLTVAGGTLALGGNNSFTGVTRVAAGVLSLANTQALSRSTLDLYSTDSGAVALSAGTTALTYTLGGLSGARNLAIGGNTLSVGGNNQSTTYAGSISGSGGLVKIGAGTFTMTGSNSYTGTTMVYGGRLVGTVASLSGTINNYSTLEFAQATSGTFAGRIMNDQVGFGQTVKSGVGTLTLTGTVSGYISVNAGTLALSAASLAQGSIINSATVVFAQPTSGSLLGTIFGAGSVLKTGSGALTLQSGYVTGTTTVAGGRLVAPATTLRGPIVNNAAFEFSQASNGEYASVLSGTGTLTKSGVGTLTLSGSSLATGLTSISGGMLATGGAERLADTSTVSISSGATLRLGGNETIGALLGSGSVNLQSYQLTIAGSGSSTYSGSIFGSGGLTKAGSGLLTLNGSNGFLGATNLNMGTLVLSSSTALSPFTTLSIAAGSTLVVNRDVRVFSYTNSGGTISGSGRLLTSATAATGGTLTSLSDVSGTDAYSVGLLKTSTATLVVSGSTSFTGGVVVEQGTVKLDAGGSFAASNVVDVRSGATLDLNGQSQTVAALAGSGSVALGGGTLTVDAATSTTFSGAIDGGSLVKSGSSALNLTGSASVSTAAVTSGLMSVNGTLAGTVAVAPGGTLGGAGTIVGDVSVSGTHAPGNSPEISTITGNLDYGVGATVVWEIAGNTATQGPPGSRTFDQILVGGNLAFSGSTAVVLSFYDQDPNSSWASTVDWNDEFWGTNHAWTLWQVSGTTTGFANLSLQTESWLDSNGAAFGTLLPNRSFSLAVSGNDVQLVYAVPEPATLALAAAGIAASGLMLRRRRQG